MGTNLCVDLACAPKSALGGGDPAAGTERIRDLLDARGRAEAMEEECARQGLSPETTKVELVVRTGNDTRKELVTVGELRARAAPLGEHAQKCAGCPARVRDEAYGCFGYASYPVPRAAEEWLMQLLRPTSELGGIVCVQAMRDFGWSGDRIRSMRAMKLFEADAGISRDLGDGAPISSDRVLEAILALGALTPTHCAIVLSWFGAVLVDGQPLVGGDKSALRPLLALPPEERAGRARLVVPEPPEGAPHGATYLAHLFRAWVTGQRLLVHA